MGEIEDVVRSNLKPKEKQAKLVGSVCDGTIGGETLIEFFQSASDVDKGTCADAMKHVSGQQPGILAPFIDRLIEYVNHRAPRVKWGISEAIGNLAREYPDKAVHAIPYLMQNTIENKTNTTVVRWCAAYGLSEIAKHNPKARGELVPKMKEIAEKEENNGVRNVYLKALRQIEK